MCNLLINTSVERGNHTTLSITIPEIFLLTFVLFRVVKNPWKYLLFDFRVILYFFIANKICGKIFDTHMKFNTVGVIGLSICMAEYGVVLSILTSAPTFFELMGA